MARIKLTKVARKPEQAAFAIFKDEQGNTEEVRITLSQYQNMSTDLTVPLLRPTATLVAGYTRFDYETPTGLLEEGQYGDDGIDKDGKPHYQMNLGGKLIAVPTEKVVADEVDDTDEVIISKKARAEEYGTRTRIK